MGKVWVTSDPHFGHDMVARLRGFDNTLDHTLSILDSIRSSVRPDDLVIWLGDLALARPESACRYISLMPGTHDLVLGNHDRGHPMYRDAARWGRVYATAFRSVSVLARRRINGGSALLSHFPYDGDHTEQDRDVQYRPRDLGLPIVHGHTHSTERVSRSAAGTLQVHVGWDAWHRPVDWEELSEIFEQEGEG